MDGKNYLKWSQLVCIVLKGKGKISHLMGTGPKLGDPRFEVWDEEDSMIMVWLWNSMPLRLATHVCSCLRLRIFGTQSNKRFQKLEMRLKYMS